MFGRLSVIKQVVLGSNPKWECLCECGKVVEVKQINLRSGDTKSCGCLATDKLIQRNTKHNLTGTCTYKKWKAMRSRVKNPQGKSACYKGINICSRWNDYTLFLADMGECPTGFSLDRIDSTKGYAPENCRWIPLKEQATNTSRNRKVIHNGVNACISTHAKANGLAPDVVFDRVNKLGWSMERALLEPKRSK